MAEGVGRIASGSGDTRPNTPQGVKELMSGLVEGL
jgi:hypothetical protein